MKKGSLYETRDFNSGREGASMVGFITHGRINSKTDKVIASKQRCHSLCLTSFRALSDFSSVNFLVPLTPKKDAKK